MFPLQQLKDIDHHKITLEPVKFSYDEDEIPPSSPDRRERRSASRLSAVDSSDDEYFDADDQISPKEVSTASAGALLVPPTSRSISVTSFEGDPPDVEEDRDFYETEDLGG